MKRFEVVGEWDKFEYFDNGSKVIIEAESMEKAKEMFKWIMLDFYWYKLKEIR